MIQIKLTPNCCLYASYLNTLPYMLKDMADQIRISDINFYESL